MTGRRLAIWTAAGIASAFVCGAGVFIHDDLQDRRSRRAATLVPVTPAFEAPSAPYAALPPRPQDWSYELPASAAEELMPRPHAPALTAEDEREFLLGQLEDTGAGGGQWLAGLGQMSEAWLGEARSRGVVTELSAWRCFQGGCAVTHAHERPEHLDAFSELVSRSGTFDTWTGGKFHTGTVALPNGRVEATWVFYAPEPAAKREL